MRDLLVVIFNTTVAAEVTVRGASGDCGGRQLLLDAGCLARLGLVPGSRDGLAAMESMCSVLAHIFSAPFWSYSPVLFFFGARCPSTARAHRLRARFARRRGCSPASESPPGYPGGHSAVCVAWVSVYHRGA